MPWISTAIFVWFFWKFSKSSENLASGSSRRVKCSSESEKNEAKSQALSFVTSGIKPAAEVLHKNAGERARKRARSHSDLAPFCSEQQWNGCGFQATTVQRAARKCMCADVRTVLRRVQRTRAFLKASLFILFINYNYVAKEEEPAVKVLFSDAPTWKSSP